MDAISPVLARSYDYRPIAVWIVIALFSALATLIPAGRVTATHGNTKFAWLTSGAFALGYGIGSVHYIEIKALRLPLPMVNYWPTVLASMFAAVAASGVALFVVSRRLSLQELELKVNEQRLATQMSEERERTRMSEAANKAKSELLANMSLEIRASLNRMIGTTDLTLGTKLSHKQHNYLETIKLSAQKLLTVINEMQDPSGIVAVTLPEGTVKEERIPAIGLDILLAEDEPVNQKLRTRLLEKRGHRVELVSNGREAVAALNKRRYDIVLMDVQMPEMDGLDAVRLIRELEKTRGGHQPVVAMTALVMEGDRERCIAAGMDAYLSKPIRPQELDEFLEKYMPASRGQVSPKTLDVTAAEAPQPSVLMDELLERVDGDRSFILELLELLRGEYPQQLEAMQEAIAAQNGRGLQRVAHALKGALGNLAAPIASGFADELEFCGRSGKMEQAQSYLMDLKYELNRVVLQLEGGCLEGVR